MSKTQKIGQDSLSDCLLSRLIKLANLVEIFGRFDFMARTLAQDLGADRIIMSLAHDGDACQIGTFPELPRTLADRSFSLTSSLCLGAMLGGELVTKADLRWDPNWQGRSMVRSGTAVGLLAVPLDVPGYGLTGALCAVSSTPRTWSELEQRYLEQTARTVVYTLQAEVSELEQRDLSEELSALDRIVTTLAADLAVPTSIYTETGALAFANAALTDLVPLDYLAEFKMDLAWTRSASEGRHFSETVEIPAIEGSAAAFRVSCSTSASGMMVCHWFTDPTRVN